ncbi:phosphate ABC transporter permease PstA [Spirabiliibacterium falconis]|uniref:phosphate ABC transporter permease PstA n=1 Tax=Spirabiliibacterium falconis TaxID=572023 RepID=UPI001AAD1AD2|nr:phosphate ABC transporter permease PstA [Spirabiliibacterium falconis]
MHHTIRQTLQRKRRLKNAMALTTALFALAFGLIWLIWILITIVQYGFSGLSWTVFTEMTPPPSGEGGLSNAIIGSVIMVGVATLLGTPLGILVGIFLAEYGRHSKMAGVMRFINDVLLSAPSIVIGLFVYALLVAPMGNFSGWAGALALALLQMPIVIRTTENMLNLVPNTLRESAYALGTPKWKLILTITLKSSTAGVATGILLGIARISGETAPLLFTALSNQFTSTDLSQPMASLPVTIFKFALSPFENWQALAWVGVLMITFTVLLLNIIARVIISKGRKS